MKRRNFIKSGLAVSVTTGLSGCLSIFDRTTIDILSPNNNQKVGKEMTIEIDVENFDLRSTTDPQFKDPGGRAVVIIGEEMAENQNVSEVDRAYDVFGGTTESEVEFISPGEKDITVQLVDDDGNALNYYSTVEVEVDFDVIDTILIGEDSVPTVNPSNAVIPKGTEITFRWEFNGAAFEVLQKPDESDLQGVGSRQREGYEINHTFDVEGIYEYQCPPLSNVMSGRIEVKDGILVQ